MTALLIVLACCVIGALLPAAPAKGPGSPADAPAKSRAAEDTQTAVVALGSLLGVVLVNLAWLLPVLLLVRWVMR